MARRGYQVTIFEAYERPGGMLRYGIPPYRLPKDVLDAEIQNILDLGVTLKCNTKVGEDIPFEDVSRDFDAVYVAGGSHKGANMDVPGEDSANIFTAASFLNRVNTCAKVDIGDRVVVGGGGDSAVDAARVSVRLQALKREEEDLAAVQEIDKEDLDEEVKAQVAVQDTISDKTMVDAAPFSKRISKYSEVVVLYRRTRAEMPAISEGVDAAQEEGIRIEYLSAAVRFITEGGRATAVECIRMELGEPDESGRRRPVPIKGSEFTLPVDTVMVGIGQKPDLVGVAWWSWPTNGAGWMPAALGKPTRLVSLPVATCWALGSPPTPRDRAASPLGPWTPIFKGQNTNGHIWARPYSIPKYDWTITCPPPRNEEVEIDVAEAIAGFSEIRETLSPVPALFDDEPQVGEFVIIQRRFLL